MEAFAAHLDNSSQIVNCIACQGQGVLDCEYDSKTMKTKTLKCRENFLLKNETISCESLLNYFQLNLLIKSIIFFYLI